MAGIAYKSKTNLFINPTINFIPVKTTNGFADSLIFNDTDFLYFYTNSVMNEKYIDSDLNNKTLKIGDPSFYNAYIYTNNAGYVLIETSAITGGSLYIQGTTDATPPTGPTDYMQINVNGSNYKIAIRKP